MNWKNAAVASWKSFKSFVLLIWSLYDCEPTPEAIARREARQAKEQEELERMRANVVRSDIDGAVVQVFAVVCLIVAAGFATWCYNNIDFKSHIPVSVTVEYR